MNYSFIGLGFVQGWLWLFFLNGPLLFSEAAGWSINNELILLCFLLANSLSFLWVKKTKRVNLFYTSTPILVTSALLMACGVLMVKLTAGQVGEVWYAVLALLGAGMAGFGSAITIAALGELFSLFTLNTAGLSFAGSVTVGTVLFFLTSKLSIPVAFLLTAFSPIIALIFIILGRKQVPEPALNIPKIPLAAFPFPRKLVVLLILFYLGSGFFFKLVLSSSASALQETFWLTNVIYWLVILVAGGCLYLFPNLDLSVLYRPVLPLLGAGFVLIPFFHDLSVFLPLTLLQTGFALFDLYTWLLFAYIAKYYQRPSYVFGMGMFLITISIFSGETLFAALFSKLSFSLEEIEIVSLCAALLMIAGTMLFQGKRDSFAGWEGPDEAASTLEINKLAETEQELECFIKETAPTPTEQTIRSINTTADPLKEQFFLSLELTKREKDVAVLILEGRNNPYIRGSLNISNNTLKTHLKNIYRKAEIKDRQELLDLFNEFAANREYRD
ncbi:MAG: hypothetical protein JL50_19470 [Peptococcaceae bacterium BICA1-7]|nr:MAG: hypothetical protein JL50_19470 [Peptococcaceae bacterium BICA1-7]